MTQWLLLNFRPLGFLVVTIINCPFKGLFSCSLGLPQISLQIPEWFSMLEMETQECVHSKCILQASRNDQPEWETLHLLSLALDILCMPKLHFQPSPFFWSFKHIYPTALVHLQLDVLQAFQIQNEQSENPHPFVHTSIFYKTSFLSLSDTFSII